MIFIGLAALGKHPYLNMTSGMAAYGVALLLMAVGLTLFFKNMDEGFDISLFSKRKSGKQHIRNCWVDEKIWKRSFKSKDAERYGRVRGNHPTYLPFDEILPWLDDLATKYEDEQVERGPLGVVCLATCRYERIRAWKSSPVKGRRTA